MVVSNEFVQMDLTDSAGYISKSELILSPIKKLKVTLNER